MTCIELFEARRKRNRPEAPLSPWRISFIIWCSESMLQQILLLYCCKWNCTNNATVTAVVQRVTWSSWVRISWFAFESRSSHTNWDFYFSHGTSHFMIYSSSSSTRYELRLLLCCMYIRVLLLYSSTRAYGVVLQV